MISAALDSLRCGMSNAMCASPLAVDSVEKLTGSAAPKTAAATFAVLTGLPARSVTRRCNVARLPTSQVLAFTNCSVKAEEDAALSFFSGDAGPMGFAPSTGKDAGDGCGRYSAP